jgi:hypothetical protein
MNATAEMIKKMTRSQSFPEAKPLLLGSIYSAIRMENLLHEAGIPWGSRAEGVAPDQDYATTLHYGQFRRWVVFVRAKDLQAAIELGRDHGFSESEHLPTTFAAGLCKAHGYETLPCSGCSTGWDWLAKSDEAEKEKVPPRHPSPL